MSVVAGLHWACDAEIGSERQMGTVEKAIHLVSVVFPPTENGLLLIAETIPLLENVVLPTHDAPPMHDVPLVVEVVNIVGD